jgi:glutathione S-transferase
MRLFWSTRSPFARKVVVAAHELGVADRIVLERVVVSQTAPNGDVMAHNPLSQIPTLVLEDGTALFDSAVIVEWLDRRFGPRLLPGEDAARFAALRLQALGDGLMENSVRRLGERSRGALFSEPHAAASAVRIGAVLDVLERQRGLLAGVEAGTLAVACGLAHLDFRHADLDWRSGRQRLADWHAGFSERPSMRLTAYRDEH